MRWDPNQPGGAEAAEGALGDCCVDGASKINGVIFE